MAPRPSTKTPARKPSAESPEARAAARESEPIEIGDLAFTRVRKTWKVTREINRVLHEQEREGRLAEQARMKADRVEEDAYQAGKDPDNDAIDALLAEAYEHQDAVEEAAYRLIQPLLRDPDGNPPALEYLQEHLDVQDVAALARQATGSAEVGPTPETAATPS